MMFHRSSGDGSGDGGFLPLQFLFRALFRWWYVTFPVAAILAVLSAALVLITFEPQYRAAAILKIASYRPYIAYDTNEPELKPEEFIETQVELLRSPVVMQHVVHSAEIAALPEIRKQEDPVGWLVEQIRVQQVGDSELFSVFLDSHNPETAALLVNAILDGYFSVRAQDEALHNQRVIELLEQEKERRSEDIARLREQMRALSADVVGIDPFTGVAVGEAAQSANPLEAIQDRLTEAEAKRVELQSHIQALEEAIAEEVRPFAEVELEMALSESEEVRGMRALIARKKENLHRYEAAAAAGKEDPGYKALEREIESLERSLAHAVNTARPEISQQLKAMAELDRKDALTELQARLKAQTVVEEMLRERYREQLDKLGASGSKSLELEFTRAELKRAENAFEMIAGRAIALQTESRAPGRISLMQPAEPPESPIQSVPLRNMALAMLLSGCLPFGLVLLWESSVRRISDVGQLSKQSPLKVVGEVAKLPTRVRPAGLRSTRASSLFEESIDSLRVGLVLPEKYQHVHVIAVTSAVHGEGKSSISSQLAVSIGRSCSDPVLLIDGDLRAPDVHHIFDIPRGPGFAAVLDGSATLEEAIDKSWSEQVHLLPAGVLRKSPHKLMSMASLTSVLDQLREHYRYIVIDTPPILSASEALLIAKVSDGTVLCTRRNFSRESQVRLAYERLAAADARPMGAVFNGVPTRSYAYTYGSYDYTRDFG